MIQLYYYIQLILFGIQRNHTVCWSFNEVCCCEASCSAFQAFQPWLVSGAMSCSWSQYIAWPSWPSYWRNSSKLGNANIDIDHISYIHMIYHIYIQYIYMIYHLSIYIFHIYRSYRKTSGFFELAVLWEVNTPLLQGLHQTALNLDITQWRQLNHPLFLLRPAFQG